MKNCILYGITGQAGSYWAEMLLEKGIKVIGVQRRTSTPNTQNINSFLSHPNLELVEGDITDMASVSGLVNKYRPTYCINMAAQSHVHTSFEQPILTFDVNAVGTLNILESIRKFSPRTRFLQASTSEMFGSNYEIKNGEKIQTENTQLSPNSPYAVAKVAAHELVRVYREAHGIFAVSAINFNFESPRRGDNFVTKKIVNYLKSILAPDFYGEKLVIYKNVYDSIALGKLPKLKLGNLDARRDWSHVKDTIRGQWLALTYEIPDDYIFCTGVAYTIREFLEKVFSVYNLKWEDYVEIDSSLFRPLEVPYLRGDNSKAKEVLGWEPEYNLDDIIKDMLNGH